MMNNKIKVVAILSVILLIIGGFLGMKDAEEWVCVLYWISPFICSVGFFIDGLFEYLSEREVVVKGIGVYIMFVIISFVLLFFEFSYMFLIGRFCSVIGASLLLVDVVTIKKK